MLTAKRPKSQVVLITRSRTKELRSVMLERDGEKEPPKRTDTEVIICSCAATQQTLM